MPTIRDLTSIDNVAQAVPTREPLTRTCQFVMPYFPISRCTPIWAVDVEMHGFSEK